MSAPTRAPETAFRGPSGEAIELRVAVTALATPTATGPRLSRSTDIVRVRRRSGRVERSWRLAAPPAGPGSEAIAETEESVEQSVRGAAGRLAGAEGPDAALQSVHVTSRRRWREDGDERSGPADLRLLIRVETVAGPLVLGGSGQAAVEDVAGALPGLRALLARRAAAPAGWAELPLLARPPVAALVVVAARWTLGSAAAAALDGRRVLPMLDLLDEPVVHADGELDDDGRPAGVHVLVSAGRVTVPPGLRGPRVAGRATWDHDRGHLVLASPFRLRLTGISARDEPEDAIELCWCVEGVRRYHADGRLRVVTLSRVRGEPGWFPVALTGHPLRLLRGVAGAGPEAGHVYSEDEVRTPALHLPSAGQLRRSGHAIVELF